MVRVLVIDDQEMMRDSLCATLERAGHRCVSATSGAEGLREVQKRPFDVVVTDLKMPRMDGLGFLDGLKRAGIELPVVMMTAYATIATAVEAIRKGAIDYIQKPFEADEIVLLLDRVMDHSRLKRENEAYRTHAKDGQRGRGLIGQSEAMREVREKIGLVAQTIATVFVRGESGTGKELVARAIHAQSGRGNKPFLCVNCAALSSALLESELFGHEKGAFTGADQMRKGRFELVEGGTLVLDEISEMDMGLQVKLLRVLQEREFERVGSSVVRHVDVRVIATTNRDLERWVREGKFREDLYYRLNVVPVVVPPLRERSGEDIEMLCEFFLRRFAEREGRELRILSRSALDLLKGYRWPGNVRELENLMERVSILGRSDVITAEAIGHWLNGPRESDVSEEPQQECLRLEQLEREHIERMLERFNGHRQRTAKALGIGVRTLGMKLKRWREEAAIIAD